VQVTPIKRTASAAFDRNQRRRRRSMVSTGAIVSTIQGPPNRQEHIGAAIAVIVSELAPPPILIAAHVPP